MFPNLNEDDHKVRVVRVKCFSKKCGGVHVSQTELDDYSPRIESKCPICGSCMSVKLSNVEKERIVSETIEDAWYD